jgi:predicted small metal-binding protein
MAAAVCCGVRFLRASPRQPGRAGAYTAFMKRIDCVCGHVVEAEDDDELWADAQEHLRTDHPDLVGKVSREDILAQAEET